MIKKLKTYLHFYISYIFYLHFLTTAIWPSNLNILLITTIYCSWDTFLSYCQMVGHNKTIFQTWWRLDEMSPFRFFWNCLEKVRFDFPVTNETVPLTELYRQRKVSMKQLLWRFLVVLPNLHCQMDFHSCSEKLRNTNFHIFWGILKWVGLRF